MSFLKEPVHPAEASQPAQGLLSRGGQSWGIVFNSDRIGSSSPFHCHLEAGLVCSEDGKGWHRTIVSIGKYIMIRGILGMSNYFVAETFVY